MCASLHSLSTIVFCMIKSLIFYQAAEFQYSLEHKAVPWSPMVANLHMGHIQVIYCNYDNENYNDISAHFCRLFR